MAVIHFGLFDNDVDNRANTIKWRVSVNHLQHHSICLASVCSILNFGFFSRFDRVNWVNRNSLSAQMSSDFC